MNSKGASIAIVIIMCTAVAMAAMVAEKMHVTKVCRDVRIAMDGAVDAVLENGGLSPHYAVTLFEKHNMKKIKIGTVDVSPQYSARMAGMEDYEGGNLRLVISNKVNPKTGRHPASLQGTVDGQKLSVAMGCSR